MSAPQAIGFLGAGQMATALAKGWCAAGLIDVSRSRASDPIAPARQAFQTSLGIATFATNAEVVPHVELIVLAVKPQAMGGVLAEIKPLIGPRHLIVSIAAGVTISQLSEALGSSTRIIRVMPNTPCLVGASAAGIAAGAQASADDAALVKSLFTAVGVAHLVPEYQLDAVTGLSGSGPAYVYVMIEALADGGVRAGLPREVALALAAQTVLGSAKMVLETKQHPGALKDAVASPGGTTIAGLHALEQAGFRGALMDAVLAASNRARELGQTNG
ncbi:MAG: pyrroline-5-carboxylate reductase [Gemmataceae bacterium]